ncbi:MAG: hypothetical protein J6Z17_05835 [Treponema sp.]|nr:hypothetical protein [Treponema sp.]
MPGLRQLQQLNTDLLTLGDEVAIRAARSEKPVTVPIPETVEDIDDSEDFRGGFPTLSEEDQAQADAAAAEAEREANDFSDIIGEEKEESPDAEQKPREEKTPDMSDIMAPMGDIDFSDLDLSDFKEDEPEPEPEEPEEVPLEDLDLDSLLTPANKAPPPPPPKPAPKKEPVVPKKSAAEEEADALLANLFSQADDGKTKESTEEIPSIEEVPSFEEGGLEGLEELGELPDLEDIDSASSGNDADIFSSPDFAAPELNEAELSSAQDFAEVPSGDFAEEVPAPGAPLAEEPGPGALATEKAPSAGKSEELSYDNLGGDFDEFNDTDGSEYDLTSDLPDAFNEEPTEAEKRAAQKALNIAPEPEPKPKAVSEEAGEELSEDALPDFEADGEGAPALDSVPDFDAADMPDFNMEDAPESSSGSSPEAASPSSDTAPETAPSIEEPASDFTPEVDLTPEAESDSVNEVVADNAPAADTSSDTSFDLSDLKDFSDESLQNDFDTTGLDDFSSDALSDSGSNGAEEGTVPPDVGDSLAHDFGNITVSDYEGNVPEKEEALPEDSVPDEEPSETFDTSGIDGIDFSGDASSNNDFELGSINTTESEDDIFNIPGFSDTVIADIDRKPEIPAEEKKAAEKNSFSDAEYERFRKNLSLYPLNVRIALEELVVKNEFTDDAVFGILEKVLRKVPARTLASELEKMLDISLPVPRDFERRSAAEYELYKKSLEYQLKNRIIPGAILGTIAAVMMFCVFEIVSNLIYRPLKARSLYKQGYELLEEELYSQSQDLFNQALLYGPKKYWFFEYAHGYRNHRQYERSRLMYRAILNRFDHDRQAGLEWAQMESNDLYNYEEAERIMKREVLDYHINDGDAILQLGDVYLDWATEDDSSRFINSLEQYNLYEELYGATNKSQARKMVYYIRIDDLREVLKYKDFFYPQKRALNSPELTELSGYLLDKRFGKLKSSEESLRFSIENLRELLERAVKADESNPVALYNMGRYFVQTNGNSSLTLLKYALEAFENQSIRNRRDTYKYLNTFRLLGEEYDKIREYLLAEETYGRGIDLFEKEHASSGFEGDENVGHMYADLADIDYFISLDNQNALKNYINAVDNKYDTPSVRYKIGYIHYNNEDYQKALGSFIKSHENVSDDYHLLLALADTLVQNNDYYVAKGYYERLITLLNVERGRFSVMVPQSRDDHNDIVDSYMKATNNLGVVQSRLADKTGDSRLNSSAIVNLQESLRAWDLLTRNQKTMIRMEGSNLAEQNIKYITNPSSEFKSEIYTEIPRTLYGETVLE